MESFYRRISYFYLYENEQKGKNCGYIKQEIRNQKEKNTIVLKGISQVINGVYDILNSNGKKINTIEIQNGEGIIRSRGDISNIFDDKIVVRFSESMYCMAEKEEKEEENHIKNLIVEATKEIEEKVEDEVEEINIQEPLINETQAQEIKKEPLVEREIKGDKWSWLLDSYENIHPFKDKIPFILLDLKDFIVLREQYHDLVHNSFLLHGYYNYKHIILGKLEIKGKEEYYLGVPGVYYHREKQAAKMFGFEAFDSSKEKAEDGDQGYYLKKVEL